MNPPLIRKHTSLFTLARAVLLIGVGWYAIGIQAKAAEATATKTTEGQVSNSAQTTGPLPVGSTVPSVTLETVEKAPFALKDAVLTQPTVLVFYRGGWCPFCNAHLSQLQTIVGELKELGYQILAVTPDLPEKVADTVAKNHLTYTLLSDPHGEALKGFGVAYRLDDGTFNKYKNNKLDLEKWSGNDAHLLPIPSLFVLDTKGVVRYVHSNPDYKVRLAPAEVLAAARAAKEQAVK